MSDDEVIFPPKIETYRTAKNFDDSKLCANCKKRYDDKEISNVAISSFIKGFFMKQNVMVKR